MARPIPSACLLQRELDQRIRTRLFFERTAGLDDAFELLGRDRQNRDDVANAARLFLEVPNELASRAFLGVALAVFREDRDSRSEQRPRVHRYDLDAVHELEHLLRRIGTGGIDAETARDRESTRNCAVGREVSGAARSGFHILAPARERGARVLRLQEIDDRLDAIDVLVTDIVFLAQIRGDIDVSDVVARGRVDAIERLEKEPVLPETFSDLLGARARVSEEALREPPKIVSGVALIDPASPFGHGLPADMPLRGERDRQHRV